MEKKNRCRSFAVSTTSAPGKETDFVLGVDEILPHVGDFGRYQKLMTILVSLVYIPVAFHPFLMYFATIVPSWKCRSNSTVCLLNGTLCGDDRRRCQIPRSDWMFTEDKMFSVVTQFDLQCDQLWIISLITFIYFAGWAVGAIVIGAVADQYGRKRSLMPSVILLLVTGMINPFMPNIYLVVLCSFILGFCYPGIETQASILLSELVGTRWRPVASRVSTLMFPVSWMVLALKAYLLKNWKSLSLVCTFPYVFTVAICFFIPESVRWLQVNNRPEEGLEILRKIGKFNKKELPPMIEVSKSHTEPVDTHSTLKEIVVSRQFGLQSFALMIIWITTLVGYYGLIIASSDLEGDVYKDFALVSVSELPGILLAVLACQKIGRKGSTLYLLAVGGMACLLIPWIPKKGYSSFIRLVIGVIGRLAIGINYNAMTVWTTELYPTKYRSSALGVMHAAARVGAASSPWIVKGLKPFGEWIPFTVMGVCALVGSVAGFRLRETRGEILRERQESEKKASRAHSRVCSVIGVEEPSRDKKETLTGFSNPLFEHEEKNSSGVDVDEFPNEEIEEQQEGD